ncbi:MAG: hydantoinase B/oxoprolinase family protein [Mariprofundaceae bacterium]|nr:hydantoinase B/oxoprolinase family protein [Mariprofundaceae bacterium]
MNAIELSLFAHRLNAVCDEMGAVLKRTAVSPNIKDREDYSCALFDADGELVAQAAHIPVHLGSMAYCMRDVVRRIDWQDGDVAVFNDPFLGGTHLPDITVVQAVFCDGQRIGFAASRAHHADVGGITPGSMGIHRQLHDEGVVISPGLWWRAGREQSDFLHDFFVRVRNPDERLADLSAQRACCACAIRRLQEIHASNDCRHAFKTLLEVSGAYGRTAIAAIPDGEYRFSDFLEDDGFDNGPLTIRTCIRIQGECASVDFSGSAPQSPGPVNCPMSVTAAAVFYAFRCLMPAETPQTSTIFRCIELSAPQGSLLNPHAGAAVAAGNVETSQRIVDVVLGALAEAIPERIPAAAQGTMNNVIFGGGSRSNAWVYYETLAGGMGAHANGDGLSAVQCHMTNTRNTSIEMLEMHYPLRITAYSVRLGSGGDGQYHGGDGLIREWQVLENCQVSLLSERRTSEPYGLNGGKSGASGRNLLLRDGKTHVIAAKTTLDLKIGDRLRIETPGGGAYGPRPQTTEVKNAGESEI